MWPKIEAFLALLASTMKYDVNDLYLEVELRNSGPTAQPEPASKSQIDKLVTAGPNVSLPTGSYDSLGSKHLEYRIIHKIKKGDINIPRPLYTWQHHVFPGNCGICVHRWVRLLDTNKWPDELQEAALKIRAQFARSYSYGQLLISTGNSFKGAERLEKFEKLYSGIGRGPVTIHVLDLRKYLGES